ncbi:hypothetical protein KP509_16G017100 [Ceratopteris richardii]|uniref:Uncharacterized protein n=1 Tax=Ceratopteris richardii TaxID=49495 RepID=A0A8T2SXT8_CERRI|nr:hypothetical protein KP509_16G017100 [Ceratopteris richardii]KAH7387331.1 hypothetical protein KP509_16G017100 [Ceratopteris richardii]KAH7387332.1 hypothetical protein KP509_16G017100 [Ceratopteris richardii]
MNTESIYPAGMEEEKTLSSILSVRTVDAVPLQTATASLMKVYQTDGHDSATSISVVHDKLAIVVQRSECNNSAIQVSLSSANNCSLVGNSSDSTENCCRLSRLGFPSDLHRYCKYVDIKESCKRHVYHQKLTPPAQAGHLPTWSSVAKPKTPPHHLKGRWPPPTSAATSSRQISYLIEPRLQEIARRNQVNSPLTNSSKCSGQLILDEQRWPPLGNIQPMISKTHPHGEQLILDEQCWPSLGNFKNQNSRGQASCISSNSKTIQPFTQNRTNVAREALFKAKSACFPPIFLMVNRDFIVISPLKQNLLLTLSLMGRNSTADAAEDAPSPIPKTNSMKRQILVGKFKAFSSFGHFMLGHDAKRVRTESNAGGTSTISESLSVEYFVRRFQAKDVVTEMEVEYCSFNWKKVDYICTLYGQRVGVSVTRAMSFPDPKEFSAQMANRLLHKKLFGLVVARHGVSKRHSFSQCILHVWCETQQTVRLLQKEYDAVSQELDIADDVIMVLTVADGYHARPIFYEYLLRDEPK